MYYNTKTHTCLKESECYNIPHAPANSALCLMIFPSTSSRWLVDVAMLMRICSDCSCRIRGLARFFHTPQIYTNTHRQVSCSTVAVKMALYMDIKPHSVYNLKHFHTSLAHEEGKQTTNAHLLNTSNHVIVLSTPRLKTFNINHYVSLREEGRNVAACRHFITFSSGVISILISDTLCPPAKQ